MNTYGELEKSSTVPVAVPRVHANGAPTKMRPRSLVILEESDLEPPPGVDAATVAALGSSYAPVNSFSARGAPADARLRYAAYANLPAGTPLLESLLDPNVGIEMPRPRAARADAGSKRSSWYAGAPVGKTPTFTSFDRLPVPAMPARNTPSPGPPPAHSAHSSISSIASVAAPFTASPSEAGSPANGNSPNPGYQPFNFQSVAMANGPPPTMSAGAGAAGTSRPNQRRGHKYKHSSVSMNFFKEDVRAPLTIPASLPVPTLKECKQSMSRDQLIRLTWGIFHLVVAFLVYASDSPFSAISALAHLLFYDAMGAIMCAVVDTLGNFDVWKTSTVHFPFGLERAEVLAGFALSIMLIFTGGDVMSHSIQDIVQSVYSGHAGAAHSHGMSGHQHGSESGVLHWGSIMAKVGLGIIVTIVSAVGLDNHSRIGRAMNHSGSSARAAFRSLPWILSNPSHFITLTFSAVILVYPVVPSDARQVIDALVTPCIATSMCYVGWILAKSLGVMLVMSFPGEDKVDQVKSSVLALPGVVSVENVSIWQVHHSSWLACMKVHMSGGGGIGGTEGEEQRVREAAGRLLRDVMSGPTTVEEQIRSYAKVKLNQTQEKVRWETTIDIKWV